MVVLAPRLLTLLVLTAVPLKAFHTNNSFDPGTNTPDKAFSSGGRITLNYRPIFDFGFNETISDSSRRDVILQRTPSQSEQQAMGFMDNCPYDCVVYQDRRRANPFITPVPAYPNFAGSYPAYEYSPRHMWIDCNDGRFGFHCLVKCNHVQQISYAELSSARGNIRMARCVTGPSQMLWQRVNDDGFKSIYRGASIAPPTHGGPFENLQVLLTTRDRKKIYDAANIWLDAVDAANVPLGDSATCQDCNNLSLLFRERNGRNLHHVIAIVKMKSPTHVARIHGYYGN